MTKYLEAQLIRRAVKQQLKKEHGKSVEYNYRGVQYIKRELPDYITDNPYYP